MAGALLRACQDLMHKGIHPTAISDGFEVALRKALEVIEGMSQPVDLNNRQQLIENAITSLSSKVVSHHSDLLAPMAVDAILKVIDKETATNVDLRDISVSKKLGGTIDDSELIDGLCFVDKTANRFAGGSGKVKNAKIGLIQFPLSAPKSDMDSNICVSDYTAIDRLLKEERKHIVELVKKVIKTGVNVVLLQKSILREAVSDLALHFLAKKNVMVIKDIERDQVDFISRTLNATPVAHID